MRFHDAINKNSIFRSKPLKKATIIGCVCKKLIDHQELFKFKYFLKIAKTRGFN